MAMAAGLAGSLAVAMPAAAQSPPPFGTYLSLLGQGFEVQSVILISTDSSRQSGQSIQEQAMVVSLQKGAVTTRCWITLATYTTGDTQDRQGQPLPMNCY